jgi:hypothetical protein
MPCSRADRPDIRLQGFVIKGTNHVLLKRPNSQQGNVRDDRAACRCENAVGVSCRKVAPRVLLRMKMGDDSQRTCKELKRQSADKPAANIQTKDCKLHCHQAGLRSKRDGRKITGKKWGWMSVRRDEQNTGGGLECFEGLACSVIHSFCCRISTASLARV